MYDFYGLNPKLLMRYQPFLAKRREKLAEDTHFDGWVFGQYFSSAISANFSKHKYPRKPFYEMELDIEEQEQEVKPLTDADRFMMYALTFNADHKNLPAKKELPVIDADASEVREINSSDKDSNVHGGE